jgi:hypothetical protein
VDLHSEAKNGVKNNGVKNIPSYIKRCGPKNGVKNNYDQGMYVSELPNFIFVICNNFSLSSSSSSYGGGRRR